MEIGIEAATLVVYTLLLQTFLIWEYPLATLLSCNRLKMKQCSCTVPIGVFNAWVFQDSPHRHQRGDGHVLPILIHPRSSAASPSRRNVRYTLPHISHVKDARHTHAETLSSRRRLRRCSISLKIIHLLNFYLFAYSFICTFIYL